MPATQSLTVTGGALATVSAPTDCDAPGCATLPNDQLRIGTADGRLWATHLKADLGALPQGARVTSAKLSLTRADCSTQCVEQKPDVFELSAPWTPAQSGKELLTAAGEEKYTSDTVLPEIDFGVLVQSWTDRGGNEGMALVVPGTAAAAAYYSGAAADKAKRPKLTIEYLPPTAPGAVSEVVAVPGDTGLVATWNAPLDSGTTGDLTYVVKAEKSDGSVVGTWEGPTPRAVFGGLDNAISYRVAVTAKNAVGSGPVSRSAPARGATVTGGPTQYKDYVQAYLNARNKVVIGTSLTAADAAAESPHGAVFGELLGTQEATLVGAREALAPRNQSYVGATSALTEVVAGTDAVTGQPVLRATVTETMTIRIDGADQVSENQNAKRFLFSVSGGTVRLQSESDDGQAGQTLSATAAAATQVIATPADAVGPPADETGALTLGTDGFPMGEAPAEGVRQASYAASYINGLGTGSWAYNNTGLKWEYKYDCTNFVSKALYYGGGMKMRSGWYKRDDVWFKNPWWNSWPVKASYTWSAAENLRRHLAWNRPGYFITRVSDVRKGDVLFFRYKGDSVYEHAAVVTANYSGRIHMAQHGGPAHTTLDDAIARHKPTPEPIISIVVIRPTGAR
ncbi:amidase domain-containing protein [Streptomyces sp. NPDC060020]|uniref:amidase domain-containing protein n=1 Tax=Streptomyces sp. NPDC060020 TaxID=3347038 RepID=UPI00367C2EDE